MASEDLLPEQHPPSQSPPTFQHSTEGSHHIRISCLPPLGQATTVPRSRHAVRFTVLLESNTVTSASNDEAAEVSLWHNHNGQHDWNELPLLLTSQMNDVFVASREDDTATTKRWYTAELSGLPKHAHMVSFTLKFRAGPSQDWRWVKDNMGIEDGELTYGATDFDKHSHYDIHHFFDGLSSDIKALSKPPETDATQLWELTCTVKAAEKESSGYQHHRIGKVKHSSKWFGLVRLWSPWLAPRHGPGGKFQLDKDGILLSFLRSDGLNVVLLGISGVDDVVSTFLNDEDYNIIIKGRNDTEGAGSCRVLVAVAETFEVANAAVFYHARRMVENYDVKTTASSIQSLMDDKVKPEWLEEWYDGLTYCTWNGLGQNLTASAIYRALDELSKREINITNLIIDDNWQSLSSGDGQFKRGWSDFEANTVGFPAGMKATTEEIRKRHPNVNHIAVWHAMFGYWGGIDPNGKIAKKYKTVQVEKEPGVASGYFTVVAAEDAARMYDDFYRFLSENGIDSVKTDAQFFLDMLLHAPDRRKLITEYQDAWTVAHLRHFSSRAISCMSQFPQTIFHSQLAHNKPRLLLRNSDDFFPGVEASHAWHIFCNAHNSLLTQHLNVLPDWDMFQTSHDWASFHAAARCVSGGPIYFTDVPGHHDVELIRQMTAQTPRGKTVILRPHIVGKTVDVYNGYSAQALLKIGTYVRMGITESGILGVFNVSRQSLSELIHLQTFPGIKTAAYVVSSFNSGKFSEPMSRSTPDTAVTNIALQPRGWDILTASTLHSFSMAGQSVQVGMLGLIGKMTGCAAVTGCNMYIESNGRLRIWVSCKALGRLGLWISALDTKDVQRDFMIVIFGKPIPVDCVRRYSLSEKVLEIDIEKAWKDSGEDAGWSNEVTVEIFMG